MAAAVLTSYGHVRGEAAPGFDVFRGIPYAAPPTGALRFARPQRPARWEGVLEATRFGPVPPQLPGAFDTMLGYDFDRNAEDCLYLNVWRPAGGQAPKPVMVWVPGGAFATGGGSLGLYDGSRLACRGDVVVVSINYRLGPFGWLAGSAAFGDDLPCSGNEGLLDIIAALEWVRDEIAAFGGDPRNVTIFGESAGAAAVTTLMGTPAAKGLFHKAIAGSGTALHMQPPEMRREYAERLVAELGIAGEPARLRDLPTNDILKADQRVVGAMSAARPWPLPHSPVVDGDVLPAHPTEAIAAGLSAGVPFITGVTAEELKLMAGLDPGARTMDDGQLLRRLERAFGSARPGLAAGVLDHYRRTRAADGLPVDPFELWYAIESDRQLFWPVVHVGELQAKHAPTWMYLFTWRSPLEAVCRASVHALDLAFVFGTHNKPTIAPFAGTGPAADALSEHIQDAWTAFARQGDPNNASLPPWPTYSSNGRPMMELGEQFALQRAPKERERQLWEDALLRGVPA